MPQEFVAVAKVSDLAPGTKKMVWLGDTRVMLANVDGEIYAVEDFCPHARAFLSPGWLEGDRIMCPLHGAEFNVKTGEVLSYPAEDDIAVYPVRIQGDDILVAEPGP